ncbi:hypothetical protein [Sphingomonas immobilis]|uniref:HEPN domain-containing protein n=1 Tax=Sphingomonas immobilis TaxID=3063997 RepID=A0ABT9A0X7_9SPHN|nr:hypothetical protein [Sphingomonas sp. CA1-15]MDO7843474.1 hypothetical protein [Sphingomonas sp. CA1-15]
METDQVISEAGLRRRIESKRAVAMAMVGDREHCREAWVAAGFAVELAVKALIVRQRQLGFFPSKDAAPELHIHNLRRLMIEYAGLNLAQAPASSRASIRQALDWERRHDYFEAPMSRKAARSMVDAAFGENGVVQWLNSL